MYLVLSKNKIIKFFSFFIAVLIVCVISSTNGKRNEEAIQTSSKNSNEKIVYPKEYENYAYVDLTNQSVLELRYRKTGDKIQPFGMKNLIKLKDFFINKGIAKHKKDEIMLLCNDKEVLWACKVGLSEKLRAKTKPTHIIKIKEV